MKKNKEKLERYIKLVDEAILIEDIKQFDNFVSINEMDYGLCFYLHEYEKIQIRGIKIIKRNNIIIPKAMPWVKNAVGKSELNNRDRIGTIKTEIATQIGICFKLKLSINLNIIDAINE